MIDLHAFIKSRLGSSFSLGEVIANNGKTSVSSGTYEGKPVVIKLLVTDDPFYSASFDKELAVLQHFDSTPPTFNHPKPLLLESTPGVIVTSRLPGAPISTDRFPTESEVSMDDVEQLLLVFDSVRQYSGFPLESRDTVLKRYEERWAKYVQHGLYRETDRAVLLKLAQCDGWLPEFNHGDVVPANILKSSHGFGLIDWEFAGPFVPGYDVAVLWATLSRHPKAQAHVIERILNASEPERLCFAVNLLNVASREVKIHLDLPEEHPIKVARLPFLMPLLDQARSIIRSVSE